MLRVYLRYLRQGGCFLDVFLTVTSITLKRVDEILHAGVM